TEHLGVAVIPDHASFVCAPECMRRVEHEAQVVPARHLGEPIDIARLPPDVHADDAGGSWRDHALDGPRIYAVSIFLNVCEYRRDLLPLQRMGGGDEGVAWHNDLTGEPERTCGDLERNGSIGHRDAVAHAQQRLDALFELADERAVVREPAVVEEIVHPFE